MLVSNVLENICNDILDAIYPTVLIPESLQLSVELSFWTLLGGSPKQDAAAFLKSGIGPTTAMDLMDEADRQAYAIVEVHRGPGQFELVHATLLNSWQR